ncbi:MAG: N-acetylmuramoyl-L-alanine amidase [Roseiflexaceae bacterium]
MRQRLFSITLLGVVILSLLLLKSPQSAAQTGDHGSGQPDQAVLTPAPILGSPGAGLSARVNSYLSPPTEAAHSFTHMLVRREASLPDGAGLALFARASADGATWGEWIELIDNDDMWVEADGSDVEWSQTLDAGGIARFWQLRGDFTPSPDGTLPELRRIEVNTVDATGPTPQANAGLRAAGAQAKPAVVSRSGWGSPDGQGSRARPSYYPVNHLVVHHTADSSTLLPGEPNWAARVRAEWSFHTITRGWGDVGYNYLIDPNGVIYEGRAGGDDAVAFHDTANYGSMGVVVIGNYVSTRPSDAAENALVQLLAWKAAQKNIDPLGSSYYYGCSISKYCYPYNAGAAVPNIASHRQVAPGHTTCPGNGTVADMSAIRNRVMQALNGGPADDGDLIVDDLESGYARSNTSWHAADCGYGGHTDWTFATDGAPENSATWRPTIPNPGVYRVYAHIPQGCGLGPPPYASAQARYGIAYAGGSASRVVDQNTISEWVDLGAYQFDQGNGGAVELYDNTGESLSAGRVLFFDTLKWVPENTADTGVQLVGIQYDRKNVASGELLKVTFTVKNTGSATVYGQQPNVDLTAGGGLSSLENGYVYDQDECFTGNAAGSYAAYPKESNRFRITLGVAGWDAGHADTCVGAAGDNPWRWGLNDRLAPGQQQTVVGYVRFRTPGTYNLRAGLIQEYVKYFAEGVGPATITVTPERIAPDVAGYDATLTPLARVYQLGGVPDNFLARTRNPLSIPRGSSIGSFAWDGSLTHWGGGGPLGQTDQFLIEQTRVFLAPTDGQYTFRTSSDDGSWLWVDGQPVVVNNGLHEETAIVGTINLAAGPHALAFKYFDRSGDATAGYDVQIPGDTSFRLLPEGLGSGARRLGGTFLAVPNLVIAADDQGGAGIDHIRWSLDGVSWQDAPGPLLRLGQLVNGSYRLHAQAIDASGNAGDMRELVFAVNSNLPVRRVFLPTML